VRRRDDAGSTENSGLLIANLKANEEVPASRLSLKSSGLIRGFLFAVDSSTVIKKSFSICVIEPGS
jgi:hypothetical protein